MKILRTLQLFCRNQGALTSICNGFHIMKVPDGASMPNVVLRLIRSGEEYSHQGPDGLVESYVRIFSRANDPERANLIGSTASEILKVFTGDMEGTAIQGLFHINTTGDESDDHAIFRQIDDYRIWHEI